MLDHGLIKECLCETIEEMTGIHVKPNDFEFHIKGSEWMVTLFGESFVSKVIEPDFVEDDVAYVLSEELNDLKRKVVDTRISSIGKRIKSRLDSLGFSGYSFSVEDRGYVSRMRHYNIESEVDRDYPDLALILLYAGKEIELEVDPYQVSEVVDFSICKDFLSSSY